MEDSNRKILSFEESSSPLFSSSAPEIRLEEIKKSLSDSKDAIHRTILFLNNVSEERQELIVSDDEHLLKKAEILYDFRNKRDRIFGVDHIFSDHAWDMLLYLFISNALQKQQSITSVCYATRAAPSTAYRWLSLLEDAGLTFRSIDPKDARRSLVDLTPLGLEKMKTVLSLINLG